MSKTCAVVVTYNRLNLLKEVVEALLAVEGGLDKIIVVNNASTDGTHNYLEEKSNENPTLEEYVMETNAGGAGGFYRGMSYAFEKGYDFFWLMDDDSVVQPNSLKMLCNVFQEVEKVGFACSKVLWTNGEPHKMNIPGVARENDNGIAFFADAGYTNITSGSFVSMLVSRKAVEIAGFPYKEFFIWADDLEYSRRIIKNGFKGIFTEKSIVIHKTGSNHNTNIQNCVPKDFWKMEYGFRNRTFLHKNFGEYDMMFLNFFRNCYRALTRKDHKIKAFALVIGSFFKGLAFNPKN